MEKQAEVVHIILKAMSIYLHPDHIFWGSAADYVKLVGIAFSMVSKKLAVGHLA